VIQTKAKVIDIGFNNSIGGYIDLLSMTTGQTQRITHVPQEVFGHAVAACVPNRLMVERTIQERGDGTTSYGTRTGMMVFHEEDPYKASELGVPSDVLESWFEVRNRFPHDAAFNAAIRKLQGRVCL
jgi:hypothetical protein